MRHTEHPKFEYNQITKYIYIGTNQCCTAHFRRALLNKGVKADISLEAERIDAPWGVSYFLWLPVKDHTVPSQQQLKIGAASIDELVKNNIKTYIHCKNGHGRAPSLVAAYLITKGKTVKEAIASIKKKRPSIHPNPKQINALKQFAKKYGN
jgi:protein-tyrosine phosphatase